MFIISRDVDEIHEMKDEINEQMYKAEDIQNALSKEIGEPTPDEVC